MNWNTAVAASIAAPPSSTAVKAGRVAATCTAVSRARSSGSRSRSQWRPHWRTGPRVSAPSLPGAGPDVFAQPGVYGSVPEQTVGRPHHPVVLVGDIQELCIAALDQHAGERGAAILDRKTCGWG